MKDEYKKPEAKTVTFETTEAVANPEAGFEWDSNVFDTP